jgi:Mannose-1-phosphate guanylyltransferase
MFWDELKLHSQDIYEVSRKSLEALRTDYCFFPNISIDYALMEKTKQMLLCPMVLEWSDMGSWDSVYECLEKDQAQNVVIGCVESLETCNSLVIGTGKKLYRRST